LLGGLATASTTLWPGCQITSANRNASTDTIRSVVAANVLSDGRQTYRADRNAKTQVSAGMWLSWQSTCFATRRGRVLSDASFSQVAGERNGRKQTLLLLYSRGASSRRRAHGPAWLPPGRDQLGLAAPPTSSTPGKFNCVCSAHGLPQPRPSQEQVAREPVAGRCTTWCHRPRMRAFCAMNSSSVRIPCSLRAASSFS
jgi:hypothetical protein